MELYERIVMYAENKQCAPAGKYHILLPNPCIGRTHGALSCTLI